MSADTFLGLPITVSDDCPPGWLVCPPYAIHVESGQTFDLRDVLREAVRRLALDDERGAG